MTFTAWLIERVDMGYPTYWDGYSMTDNIEKAVLFQHKSTAQRIIDKRRGEWGRASMRATEHQFLS